MGKLIAISAVTLSSAIAMMVSINGTTILSIPAISFGNVEEFSAASRESMIVAEQPSTIAFVGDILLGRDVEKAIERYGEDYPFQALPLHSYETVIGNFEAAIPLRHQPTPLLAMRFSVASSSIPMLRTIGITHLSLANNHSGDFGSETYDHTRAVLQRQGIATFGHGTQLSNDSITFFSHKDQTYAVIGIHTLFTEPDTDALVALITQASEQSDWQIAYIHWGREYENSHDSAQARFAETLIDQGIDLVVGHHPHVVQDVGVYKGVPIVYSLGNYVFDQYFSLSVQQGLLLELERTSDGHRLVVVPITSVGSRTQPRRMPAYERALFLRDLAERSEPELRAQILHGSINF